MAEARSIVNADDAKVRVTTWTFDGPGAAIGWHRHEFDYVVVPVTGGQFTVIDADRSERTMDQVPATPYLGVAGTEHDVVSASDGETVFVEIELKC